VNQSDHILIVDDEPLFLRTTAALLSSRGYQVETAVSVSEATELLGRRSPELALVDLNLPGNENLELLQLLRSRHPETFVIVITGHPSIPTAIASLRLRIHDYLLKPVSFEDLLELVRKYGPSGRNASDAVEVPIGAASESSPRLLGLRTRSAAMRRVYEVAERVARTDVNILITGETGTGKEVIASEIHGVSNRRKASFQPIDCAAIPEGLMESIFFGHTRGAFTGASGSHQGMLLQCHGGTGFLDEIAELPVSLQSKLLRAIQNESFVPVGDTREVKIDTRFISATSRDLEVEMAEGRFRRDLYYRLAVVHLRLPPLRDRIEDLEFIADDLFRRLGETNRKVKGFSSEAWSYLRAYSWPGNIRELRNVIERGLSLASGQSIEAGDLPAEILESADLSSVQSESPAPNRIAAERSYFEGILRAHGGNVTSAATQAGMSRQGLHRVLRRLGIVPADFRTSKCD
jgi:DNA-binding NtrC family response regulator